MTHCLGLLFLLGVLIAEPVSAAELQFQLEPMWLSVGGYDIHAGDEYVMRNLIFGTSLYYGAVYTPITLTPQQGFAPRISFSTIREGWEVGATGWWFSTTASRSGRVVTTSPTLEEIRGVRMWAHTLIPEINQLEPASLSPVTYEASSGLQAASVDFFAAAPYTGEGPLSWRWGVGLKLGYLRMTRMEMEQERAFLYDAFGPGEHWDNAITLRGDGKVTAGPLLGPSLTFTARSRHGAWTLEGTLGQSFLWGSVKEIGVWTDVDDIYRVTGPIGGPFTTLNRDALFSGAFTVERQRNRVVPVNEAKLTLSYQASPGVMVSLGGFAALWWMVPGPPRWEAPGSWIWSDGSGFRFEERNLLFYGLLASVRVAF